METLAYLQLALAYEAPATLDPVASSVDPFFLALNWKKLSSSAFIHLVSLALIFGLLDLSTNAQTFERGQTSTSVQSIQKRLKEFGYFDGPVTGFYGSLTEEAVKRFQQAYGLRVTGKVDPETLATMGRLSNPVQKFGSITQVGSDNRFVSLGETGLEVSAIQQQLQDLGYLNRPPTGEFDPATQNAILRFQRDYRLQQTGVVGPTTRAALQQQQRPVPTQAFQAVTPRPQTNLLQRGDKGVAVQALQERLIVAGYPLGTTDGTFDPLTEQALKRFQSGYGLVADGIAGKATREALEQKFYVVVVPKRNSATLTAVRQIFPEAFDAKHRLGDYIHAGSYVRREVAETRSKILQQRGLSDARVAYF